MRLIQEQRKFKDPIFNITEMLDFNYREFNSISEMYDYLCNTPINEVFRWKTLRSSASDYEFKKFSGTSSYEEAVEKLLHGDQDISKRLTEKAKFEFNVDNQMKRKSVYDVQGFQASVPRYLQGIPTAMVNQKMVPAKQRVITITKSIGYTSGFSTEEIIKEAMKTMRLIRQIEARGIRCNLYVTSMAKRKKTVIGYRVKIKNANEKINISKLAFPLANPSMLRRLSFRYREVAPETTRGFVDGYGMSVNPKEIFEDAKGHYYIPSMMDLPEEEWLRKIGL